MQHPILLIDLDNTLYDYERAALTTRGEVLTELGQALGAEPATLHAAWEAARRSIATAASGHELRRARFALLLEPYAARGDAELWAARFTCAFSRAVRWSPGAQAAFERLAAARCVMVVTEGYDDIAAATLAALGIPTITRLATHGTGTTKRDGSAFTAALASLGAAPKDALVIGDNYALDVLGSAERGIASLWLTLGREPPPDPPRTLRGTARDLAAAAARLVP